MKAHFHRNILVWAHCQPMLQSCLCMFFGRQMAVGGHSEYSHGDEHKQDKDEPRADEHQAGDFKHFAGLSLLTPSLGYLDNCWMEICCLSAADFCLSFSFSFSLFWFWFWAITRKKQSTRQSWHTRTYNRYDSLCRTEWEPRVNLFLLVCLVFVALTCSFVRFLSPRRLFVCFVVPLPV